MNILVTGVTGFIGREFVKAYSNKYNIVVLTRKSSDTNLLKNLNCVIERYDNYLELDTIFKKHTINGLVHFASSIVIDHKLEQIDDLLDSNIKYGTYLLEACTNYKVQWFINTGTFWQNYNNESYNPVNLYAATKESFQKIGKYYTEISDLIFTTVKLNDTFGPNDTRNKVFNLWAKIAKTTQILEMSAGEQIIDISYIEDVLSAYDILIKNLSSTNNLEFNNKEFVVTNKDKMSLKELSRVFEEATNTKLNIVWDSKPYRKREVMIPFDNGITVPNWVQKYTLKEAIIKTIGEIK